MGNFYSILLDILTDDPVSADRSELALRAARNRGRLVICEAVIAEIRPAFFEKSELLAFYDEIGLEYQASSQEAALLAGVIYTDYLANRGNAKRAIPDFLISAPAMVERHSLLARDRGYYQQYCKELDFIDPEGNGAP